MSRHKVLIKKFFDRTAAEWHLRTYDPHSRLLKFPGNRVRKDIAIAEIERLSIRGAIMDLGCGNGELVIDLLRRGYQAFGIDISVKMIEVARKALRSLRKIGQPEEIFRVADLDGFAPQQRFSVVTALGVLEYLEHDQELFKTLQRIVVPGGYAIIGCRNKLFNLFSANNYTIRAIKNNEFNKLILELERAEQFCLIPNRLLPELEQKVCSRISRFLARIRGNEARQWLSLAPRSRQRFVPFPKHMKRRQHTPAELSRCAERFGFALRHVVYWHCHPFPPSYEVLFPRLYNKLSLLLAPLGYSSLGAWCGSSFVAVLRKKH